MFRPTLRLIRRRGAGPFSVAALSLLLAGGCTQDYICQCTVRYSGKPGLPDSSVREYNIRDRKETARTLCADNSFTVDSAGIRTEETCVLY